ncbi:hypothetical protein CONPUDRAFT_74210 [Coniophora puteana RWD-64-598 SS2]|uniref:F-box domain-containing protein n=1 Tax=Coniophora puteana (strain RWD-64-598) TaxID=741705 RepID=A0A5M3MKX1_CONPW|nr:uncharacterized protein CONPUDRAFT_74210 [Coniophora puteana RWD-64-598 SS2]EIW79889.1 hypothetical protein CONPUDRAFT_74210 [Coniophora puteana RWD-64-598 SS2]
MSHVEGNDSLARLARVCTSFQDPALDALYANVECFVEFFASLPNDVCLLKELTAGKHQKYMPFADFTRKKLIFKREISASEWSALIMRAARVKHIRQSINELDSCRVVPSMDFADALNKCPVSVLFPNLRTLYFTVPFGPLNACLLFGPQLRYLALTSLSITFLNGSEAASKVVAATSHWPLLEECSIQASVTPPLSLVDLMTILRRCPYLRRLGTGLCISVSSQDVATVLAAPELRARNNLISAMGFKIAPDSTTFDSGTLTSLLQETMPQLTQIYDFGVYAASDWHVRFWDEVRNGLKTKSQGI